MKRVETVVGIVLAVPVVVLTGFMLLTAGWESPPIDSEQSGFRGTGMAEVSNPRIDQPRLQAQLDQVPASSPLTPDGPGPTAGEIYQNVQVLGDLSVGRFNRLMQAMTDWVSPEEGCAGCHQLDNLAAETVYTKVVARRMLEMTRSINGEWDDHVGETGVTCYTCHRGQRVPQYAWFNADPADQAADGMGGWRAGQNRAAEQVGLTSLPEDPFTDLLENAGQIRVASRTALPEGFAGSSIQATEKTYALMMHMSTALDVNCTYCHNSRDFGSWEQSSPQRVSAWHGIRMTQLLNVDYVAPLSSVLPSNRLGPTGEGHKINCQTCHQGVNKPLGGLAMAEDFPSLQGEPGRSQESLDAEAEALASAQRPEALEASERAEL